MRSSLMPHEASPSSVSAPGAEGGLEIDEGVPLRRGDHDVASGRLFLQTEVINGALPAALPVGMGKTFGGIFDLRADRMRVFRPGEDRVTDDDEVIAGLHNVALKERFGMAYDQALSEIELIQGASEEFSREKFLDAKQTPVFFGSAVNNFGVREVLDALVPQATWDHLPAVVDEWFGGLVDGVMLPVPADPANDARFAEVIAAIRGSGI
mgnify:CR=1 FL=1